MRKVLLMAAVASMMVACDKSGYTITGDVQGFADGTKVYLSKIGDNDLVKIDSTEIVGNSFEFKGDATEVEYSFIQIEESKEQPAFNIAMILENGEIKVAADKKDPTKNKISGTKNNDDLAKFNEKASSISKEIQDFQTANMEKFQTASAANDTQTVERLMSEMETLQNKLVNEANTFIDGNKDSYVSLLLLTQFGTQLTDEEFKTKYNNLSQEVKQTKIGKEVSEKLKKSDAVATGQKAPDFKAKTPEGKEISLYENLGKVTIIDFWASWCGPCRQENPNVVKLYSEYKDKGLQIVGVSLDKEEAKWKKAIADDQLTWIHMSNLQFWQDPIAKEYNVESIPATFILDQNGIIVAKNLRGAELDAKIAELLK